LKEVTLIMTNKTVMIDDRNMYSTEEGDHHHFGYRCPHCGFPQILCLKKNKLIFPETINYRDENHTCPICHKKHHVDDILTESARKEYYKFHGDILLRVRLIKIPKFFYKVFKDHDRLYALSPDEKLKLTMDLMCHIDEIKDVKLRNHLRLNSTKLKHNEKINWNRLMY